MSDLNINYELTTFGCKVNTYDSGLLEKQLQQYGFIRIAKSETACADADQTYVHVLNSCAVTAEATHDVIRQARRIKRDHPDCLIVVTGCSAQVDTEKIESCESVDLIVANSHKSQLPQLLLAQLRSPLARVHKSNIFKQADLGAGGGIESAHTRAFLKVQDGCNSFCTFCVIPFARGKSRSLAIEDLRQRVDELLAAGVREIVLTGVHIGDYEFGLENLIEDILLRTRVPRLRLTSLEPVEISERLIEMFTDPRLCPHFHMSIQSASTKILARMKRKYAADDVTLSLHNISKRIPGAFVGMDVIVGFPGESDDEFAETYARLNETPWTRIHVFPYSERPGTYATRLDGKLERSVIVRRAQRLRELSQKRYAAKASEQIGSIKKALILKNGKALARDYWCIELDKQTGGRKPENLQLYGREVALRVTAFSSKNSEGEPILMGEIIGYPSATS